MTRYASIVDGEVEERMEESEEAYVVEVRITRLGKLRGVKVLK